MTDKIIESVERRDFRFARHPIHNDKFGHHVGYEILARWNTDTLTPDDFIPEIERLGLAKAFTEIVLLFSRKIQEKIGQVPLWINVSPSVLTEGSEWLYPLVEMIPHARLEITEVSAISPEGIDTVRRIRERGVQVYLDDYAPNHPSDNFCEQFDGVKIDKSVLWAVRGSHGADGARHFLRGLVKNLKEKNIEIIIEGVETESDVRLAQAFGIHLMQGYIFGYPEIVVL